MGGRFLREYEQRHASKVATIISMSILLALSTVPTEALAEAREEARVALEDAPSETDALVNRSAQLSDFVLGARIEGLESLQDEPLTLEEGTQYELVFVFAENNGLLFDMSGELLYAMPEGFIATDEHLESGIPVFAAFTADGEENRFEVTDFKVSVEDGFLALKWVGEEAGLAALLGLEDVRLEVPVLGSFMAGTEELDLKTPSVVYEATEDGTIHLAEVEVSTEDKNADEDIDPVVLKMEVRPGAESEIIEPSGSSAYKGDKDEVSEQSLGNGSSLSTVDEYASNQSDGSNVLPRRDSVAFGEVNEANVDDPRSNVQQDAFDETDNKVEMNSGKNEGVGLNSSEEDDAATGQIKPMEPELSDEVGLATAAVDEGVVDLATAPEDGERASFTDVAPVQFSKAEDVSERIEYAYEDDEVRVVATVSDPRDVPDDAELVVRQVLRGTAGHDYEAYLDVLADASGVTHDGRNTLLYDVSFVLEGQKVEPAGLVTIIFQFKQRQLETQIGAKPLGEVMVTHLPEEAGEVYAEPVDAGVSISGEVARFESSSFSVFAFSYTVDFELGGYRYTLPGEGKVRLSQLMLCLGIAEGVSSVESAEFSDPTLVSVTRDLMGPDWTLKSLVPFNTEESLTILLASGARYIVNVTDAQLAITRHPTSVTATDGQQALFSVDATGDGLSYKWQTLLPGESSWKDTKITGYNTNELVVDASTARSGRKFRCVVSSPIVTNSITSNAATLTVVKKPKINSNPANVSATVGQKVFFGVTAEGNGLTYQWETLLPGKTAWQKTSFGGCKTETLSFVAASNHDGRRYRCVITDKNGYKLTSGAATLVVSYAPGPVIMRQPIGISATEGQDATFSVDAAGTGLTYKWQTMLVGETVWKDTALGGCKTPVLNFVAGLGHNGRSYRCVVKDGSGRTVTTSSVKLQVVAKPKITKQPIALNLENGDTASFTVTATGTGLAYHWQTMLVGKTVWQDTALEGCNTNKISFVAGTDRSGRKFRCVVRDKNGFEVISTAALLTVKPKPGPAITRQPASLSATDGQTATFSVTAAGTNLSYQWQTLLKGETTWKNTGLPGYDTFELTVNASIDRSGRKYRCVVKNSTGVSTTSDAATLTVVTKPKITAHPQSTKLTSGQTATFEIIASGTGITYQWETLLPGRTAWQQTALTGSATRKLSVDASTDRSGRKYRCVVTDKNGVSITSTAATLTVYPIPEGDIDLGRVQELIDEGAVEVTFMEDGVTTRTLDGTFTGKRVTSATTAAEVMNSASSIIGDGFHANANDITMQSLGGSNFYRYTPERGGIPVLGSEVVIRTNANNIVEGMYSTYEPDIDSVSTNATISGPDAIAVVMSSLRDELGYTDDDSLRVNTTVDLVVDASDQEREPALRYVVSVEPSVWHSYANLGDETMDTLGSTTRVASISKTKVSRETDLGVYRQYYVLANGQVGNAGTITDVVDMKQGARWYSATIQANDMRGRSRVFDVQKSDAGIYRMRDLARDVTTYEVSYFGSVASYPGELVQFTDEVDEVAVSAQANMEEVYDFYYNVLGRDSFDGMGTPIKVSINEANLANAYWDSGLGQMVFGDLHDYTAALDVMGHEFTHAVINYTVGGPDVRTNLIYKRESGALNESLADIMGTLIENKSDSGRWLIAEDSTSAIRSMSNPASYGDPTHYRNRYIGDGDRGGVHTNSSIFNLAAYKMMTDSRTSGVSRDRWAKLFYYSLPSLATNANFLDARGAILSTARTLGMTSTQIQAIRQAFDAVGITPPDSVRIIMEWGATPSDLDSYFYGPLPGSGTFETWYSNKKAYGSSKLVADLDLDDTNSYGPEITTLHVMTPGTYRFAVHDYSNRNSSSSTAMSSSGAKVRVYHGSTLVASYTIRSGTAGTWWDVFKLTVSSNGGITVSPVLSITDNKPF